MTGDVTSNVLTLKTLGVIDLYLNGLQTEKMRKRCYAVVSEPTAAHSLGSLAITQTISFSERESELMCYDE